MAAKKFQEMLEDTIRQYHERRKHLTAEEAGAAQEETSEEIIKNATEQALQILINISMRHSLIQTKKSSRRLFNTPFSAELRQSKSKNLFRLSKRLVTLLP